MKYTVNYLAEDGQVRHTEVEADDADSAKIVALDNNMGNFGGDSILQIISVEQS